MHTLGFFWPFLNLLQNENFRWQLEQMFAEQMSFLILPDQRYQSTEGRFSFVYCSYHNMTLMVLLTFIIIGCLFCRLVVNMCHWSISWWMPHMIYQTKLIQSRYVHNTWDFFYFFRIKQSPFWSETKDVPFYINVFVLRNAVCLKPTIMYSGLICIGTFHSQHWIGVLLLNCVIEVGILCIVIQCIWWLLK